MPRQCYVCKYGVERKNGIWAHGENECVLLLSSRYLVGRHLLTVAIIKSNIIIIIIRITIYFLLQMVLCVGSMCESSKYQNTSKYIGTHVVCHSLTLSFYSRMCLWVSCNTKCKQRLFS
jgi:hypothetical protein